MTSGLLRYILAWRTLLEGEVREWQVLFSKEGHNTIAAPTGFCNVVLSLPCEEGKVHFLSPKTGVVLLTHL